MQYGWENAALKPGQNTSAEWSFELMRSEEMDKLLKSM